MAIGPYATSIAKWGIPEKSIKHRTTFETALLAKGRLRLKEILPVDGKKYPKASVDALAVC